MTDEKIVYQLTVTETDKIMKTHSKVSFTSIDQLLVAQYLLQEEAKNLHEIIANQIIKSSSETKGVD